MLICSDCGAQKVTHDLWQGGDALCEHFFTVRTPPEKLVSELKMLLVSYKPEDIIEAAQCLCRR